MNALKYPVKGTNLYHSWISQNYSKIVRKPFKDNQQFFHVKIYNAKIVLNQILIIANQ